jgi:ribonuclease HII
MARTPPDFSFETAAHARALAPVAGVDEVGRGPLAGPVTAAAVILDPARIPQGLGDSKALSATKRERLYAEIMGSAQVSVAHATVEEIDALNILGASHLAMERAVAGLGTPPAHVLVDGNFIPAGLQGRAEAIVKGDAKSLSIAAASIIAKVTRDRIMVGHDQAYPGYGFARHKGYGTAMHQEALRRHGVTPLHRTSFAPIAALLAAR